MFLDQAYLHVQPGDSSQARLEKKMWDYMLHEDPDVFLDELEAMLPSYAAHVERLEEVAEIIKEMGFTSNQWCWTIGQHEMVPRNPTMEEIRTHAVLCAALQVEVEHVQDSTLFVLLPFEANPLHMGAPEVIRMTMTCQRAESLKMHTHAEGCLDRMDMVRHISQRIVSGLQPALRAAWNEHPTRDALRAMLKDLLRAMQEDREPDAQEPKRAPLPYWIDKNQIEWIRFAKDRKHFIDWQLLMQGRNYRCTITDDSFTKKVLDCERAFYRNDYDRDGRYERLSRIGTLLGDSQWYWYAQMRECKRRFNVHGVRMHTILNGAERHHGMIDHQEENERWKIQLSPSICHVLEATVNERVRMEEMPLWEDTTLIAIDPDQWESFGKELVECLRAYRCENICLVASGSMQVYDTHTHVVTCQELMDADSCDKITLPAATRYLSISTDTMTNHALRVLAAGMPCYVLNSETLRSWSGACLMRKRLGDRLETIVKSMVDKEMESWETAIGGTAKQSEPCVHMAPSCWQPDPAAHAHAPYHELEIGLNCLCVHTRAPWRRAFLVSGMGWAFIRDLSKDERAYYRKWIREKQADGVEIIRMRKPKLQFVRELPINKRILNYAATNALLDSYVED